MLCERRPEFFCLPAIILCLSTFIAGCGNRGNTPGKVVGPDAKSDPIATALQRLETDSDANTCREVLQALDSALSANDTRPDIAVGELQKIGDFAKLHPNDVIELASKYFSSTDADYLSECLLLRDVVKALELEKHAPEVRVSLAFAWLCRHVYLIDRTLPGPAWLPPQPNWVVPAPPWWVLEDGSGCAIDRAVIFLGILRQMGVDGCLIGPPQLHDSPAYSAPTNERQGPTYAPIRAVGARIGKEILLFDPHSAKPILNGKGNKPATLAEIRTNPELSREWIKTSGLKSDEVESWEVFLCGPLSSLSPRFEWLQQQLAASNAVVLHYDPIAARERIATEALSAASLKGTKCRYWNPTDDQSRLSPTFLLNTYNQQQQVDTAKVASLRKISFWRSRFPIALLPPPMIDKVALTGRPLERVAAFFESEFAPVFITAGSPRDKMLRGQFSSALAALDDLDRTNGAHRRRLANEPDLEGALREWSEKANPVFAAVISAERSGDPAAIAKANADEDAFLKSSASDRLAMFVRSTSSVLLSAEAKYLIALVVHERAERIQAQLERAPASELKTQAFRTWENAVDNWRVFLSNFPELNEFYKPRFDHARELQRRAQQALSVAKNTN